MLDFEDSVANSKEKLVSAARLEESCRNVSPKNRKIRQISKQVLCF